MPTTSPHVCVLTLLACLASAGALSAQTPAEAESAKAAAAEAAEFDALLERLTPPLQRALVNEAVRHPRVADAEAAGSLVVHLTVHKGMAAANGLLVLAGHADAQVRVAALRGIASLGLRAEIVADGVRDRLRDVESEVHAAAIAALGAVGEADDVPNLIELLGSEDATDRAAAFRALRSLTGVRLANDSKVWSHWWTHAGKELGRRIDEAILVLTEPGTEVQAADARQVLGRAAWFTTRRLEKQAREWLAAEDPRLRTEALLLVAGARLGDLSEDVLRALVFEQDAEVLRAGEACVAVLANRAPRSADSTPPGAPR